MLRLNRVFLAIALVAAVLACTTFAAAQTAPATQTRARFVDTVRGPADVQYLKPVIKVEKDGTIVTTTYGHWTAGEQPYILSVRLKLSELDAMGR